MGAKQSAFNMPPDLISRLNYYSTSFGRKPFLVILSGEGLKQFSFQDALFETRRWAAILRQAGATSGDRVFIALTHSEESYFAFLGAMWNGSVPTIIPFPTPKQDPVLYWAEYSAMLEHARPRIIVTFKENIAPLRAALRGQRCMLVDVANPPTADSPHSAMLAPAPARPQHTALLQFSSGTTGLRKGVMLTHGQIACHMDTYTRAIGLSARDTVASWLPLYHDMGLMACFLMPLYAGATIVSLDAFAWVARPWSLLEAMQTYKATFAWLPNFAFQHIARTMPADEKFSLEHVRAFINCSEPCKVETFDRFALALKAHGVCREQLQVCYAMAETVFAVTQTPVGSAPRAVTLDRHALEEQREVRRVAPSHPAACSFLSCGRPVDGMQLRIAQARDGEVARTSAPSMVGEIEVRGPQVFSGYFRNEAATEGVLNEGWYRTGDLGFLVDGELFVCGRTKDQLIVHGRNYYAHDIEAIVSAVPHVRPGRVVVFGVDDPATGSEEAVVLLETDVPDHSLDETQALRRAVKEAIFNRLDLIVRSVVVVEAGSIIKTTSGKPSRVMNKNRYAAMHAEASL